MSSLTIVTVTYNSSAVIAAMLASVPQGIDIIVVDNASSDDTVMVVSANPHVHIIQNSNTGYGRGANRGLSEVKTPYALLVNPDVILSENAVAIMLASMETHPGIGMCAARLFQRDGTGKHYAANPVFDAEGIAHVEWLSGALLMIRMEALEKTGMFDENIFLFYEETDLCKRFIKSGHTLALLRGAEAEHAEGNSSPPSLHVLKIKAWHGGWSRSFYYRKHFPRSTYWRKSIGKLMGNKIRFYKALFRRDKAAMIKISYESLGVLSYMCGMKPFKNGVGRFT